MELTSKSQKELDQTEEVKNLKKLEAALFISGRFLSLQELVTLTDINPILLRELIEKLIEKYNEESGIEILNKEENWKMDVRQEYRDMVNRLATGTAEFSLFDHAMNFRRSRSTLAAVPPSINTAARQFGPLIRRSRSNLDFLATHNRSRFTE